ncbi:sulfur oxidation c-type cytochrome SoxA [Hoeflea sp. TYP-13]|uniref:sulfur oxidation c-type cytochrome SoxA n=1 Tax=Hoeflea sp. TYP-13 TaxID=3230023 RepID=UPI0034C64094
MKLINKGVLVCSVVAASMAITASAQAGPDEDELSIEGEKITTFVEGKDDGPLTEVYSGWRFRSDETQALQMDDFENPAFVAVDQALDQFETVEGAAGKSCASCHEGGPEEFEGLRAALPRWNASTGKPETLEHIINECRTERMQADPWKWEAKEMLNMTALIGLQSRGAPVKVQTDGEMTPWYEKGKELYYTRVGQLDMSCANCHEDNYGNMIRADHLSQGQTNGFPVYRLKWAGLGSIHRRFKGCMQNIRATPYKRGSDEFIALELYVASRGEGLAVETPAVRN